MAFCRPLAFLFICCAVIKVGTAHFSLTYPKARFPDYDFLDNVRTGGPCGVGNGMNVSVPSIAIHVMSFFICLYDMPGHIWNVTVVSESAGRRAVLNSRGRLGHLSTLLHDSSRTHGYQHVYGHAVQRVTYSSRL